ncbi:hypothetical protein [Tomitella gaofuii]|uniref:hypothetical protein n=1 Tax=Tomitella gaofuii TaxID=2760083 RepID=UPI0015F9A573|nr:hypothetical protein [Tomitella gaofuii]
MIVPAVFDAVQYSYSLPPAVGERVCWELVWNESMGRWWSALQPGWRITTALRPADEDPVMMLGGRDMQERVAVQPSIASSGGLRVRYETAAPVPLSLTMHGAVRVLATTNPRPGRRDALPPTPGFATFGEVTRLRLVSMLIDWELKREGWIRMEPAPGAEWIYELAEPPPTLHHYRPPGEDTSAVRNEVLLVDLAVPD